MNRQSSTLWVAALIATVAAACAGTSGTSTTTQPTASTTALETTTTGAPNLETVEVALTDFAFEGLPDTVASGTRLTVTNGSASELHELVAFRLADGDQRSATELASLPPEEMGPALGAPVAVLIAPLAGPQIDEVGDGVLTAPGRYAIFCFIPTGIDPQEYLDALAASEGPPQIEGGGPPHFVNGMVAELTVTG